MLIAEVIEKLNEIMKTRGDLNVVVINENLFEKNVTDIEAITVTGGERTSGLTAVGIFIS